MFCIPINVVMLLHRATAKTTHRVNCFNRFVLVVCLGICPRVPSISTDENPLSLQLLVKKKRFFPLYRSIIILLFVFSSFFFQKWVRAKLIICNDTFLAPQIASEKMRWQRQQPPKKVRAIDVSWHMQPHDRPICHSLLLSIFTSKVDNVLITIGSCDSKPTKWAEFRGR